MKNKIKLLATILGFISSVFAMANDMPMVKRDSIQQLLEQRIIELGKNKLTEVMAQNFINDQRNESYKNNYIIDFSFIDSDVLVADYFKALNTSPTPIVTCGQPSNLNSGQIADINLEISKKNELIPVGKPKIYFGVNFNTGFFSYDTKVVSLTSISDYAVGTDKQKKGVTDIKNRFNQIVTAITPSTGPAVMISMGFYCKLEIYGKNNYPSLGGILTYSYKTPEPDQTTKSNVARIFRESQMNNYPKDYTTARNLIIDVAENFKKALMGELYNIPAGMGKDFFDQYMVGYSQFSKELKDIALMLNELGATGYGGYARNANVVQEITAASLAKFKTQLEAYRNLLIAAKTKLGTSTTAADIDDIVTKLTGPALEGLSAAERVKCIKLLSAFPDIYPKDMLIIKTEYYATYGGGNSLAVQNMVRKVSFFDNIVKILNTTPANQVLDIIAALQGQNNDILKKIINFNSDSMPFNMALLALLQRNAVDFEARKTASGTADRLFIFHNLNVFSGEQDDEVGSYSIDVKYENGKIKYKRKVADGVVYSDAPIGAHEAPPQRITTVEWKELDASYVEVDPLELVELIDRTYLPLFDDSRKDDSYYTNNQRKANVVPAIFLWYFFEKQKDELFWARVQVAGDIIFLASTLPAAPLSLAAVALKAPRFTTTILRAYRYYNIGTKLMSAGNVAFYSIASNSFQQEYKGVIDGFNLIMGLSGAADLTTQAIGARFLRSYSEKKNALIALSTLTTGNEATVAKKMIDFAEAFRLETGKVMNNINWFVNYADDAIKIGTISIKNTYEATYNWLKAIGKIDVVTPNAEYAVKFRNQQIAKVIKDTEGKGIIEVTSIVNSSDPAVVAIAAIPEASFIVKSGGAELNPIINCKGNGVCGFGFPGCFDGKSLVYTRNGYKAIMDVDTSDYVLAFNENTKEEKFERVANTYKRTSNKFIKIYVKGDTIRATPEHPFFVDNKWVFAGNLKKGDKLTFSKDYNPEIIASTDKMPYLARSDIDSIATEEIIGFVYNLEVANSSTFFVGKNKILVHNECEIERTLKTFLPEIATEVGAVDEIGKLRKTLKDLTNAVNVFGNSTTSVTLQSKIRELGREKYETFFNNLVDKSKSNYTLWNNAGNLTPDHIDAWEILYTAGRTELARQFADLDAVKKFKELIQVQTAKEASIDISKAFATAKGPEGTRKYWPANAAIFDNLKTFFQKFSSSPTETNRVLNLTRVVDENGDYYNSYRLIDELNKTNRNTVSFADKIIDRSNLAGDIPQTYIAKFSNMTGTSKKLYIIEEAGKIKVVVRDFLSKLDDICPVCKEHFVRAKYGFLRESLRSTNGTGIQNLTLIQIKNQNLKPFKSQKMNEDLLLYANKASTQNMLFKDFITPTFEAHHLIPTNLLENSPALQFYFKYCNNNCINFNSDANGIWLLKDIDGIPDGVHTFHNDYDLYVSQRLQTIMTQAVGATDAQKAADMDGRIRVLLEQLRTNIRNNSITGNTKINDLY